MDISNFFRMRIRLDNTSYVQVTDDQLLNVGEDQMLAGDYSDVDLPLWFRRKYGRKWGDLVGTGWLSLYLISDRLKTALEDNRLSGWQTFQVEVIEKGRTKINGYHGLSILGRCGPTDFSKSQIINKQLVAGGPMVRHVKGLHVGLDKWDGKDLFLPDGSKSIIITNKAATALKDGNFENLELTNLADIEIPGCAGTLDTDGLLR